MAAMSNTSTDIGAVALLDEPVRRALYEHVSAAAERSAATRPPARPAYLGPLPRSTWIASLRGGLLVAEYRRLSGRTGPGAGRPAKLYRRAPGDVVVSLPDRRYDVPALVFAETIEQIAGTVPPDTLRGLGPARR